MSTVKLQKNGCYFPGNFVAALIDNKTRMGVSLYTRAKALTGKP